MNPSASALPLSATDRRVLGVLVEKAKTVPDSYPMTLNGIRTGSNQKNNRHPLTQLDEQDIEDSLDRLRELGAVTEIQDSGRVRKFKHRIYEWMGVDKVQAAVMAELLLRGAQTVGELRTRASRMEPIADQAALSSLLDALRAKSLVVFLSPEGRGAVVTHNLYRPQELEKLRAEFAHLPAPALDDESSHAPPRPVSPTAAAPARPAAGGSDVAALRNEIDQIRQQVRALSEELEQLRALARDVEDVRRQLGLA